MALAMEDEAVRPRLPVIDIVRGVAIAAMVVYHTAFDLSADRLIATDVIGSPWWRLLARATAGTFLLLVGVSLVLAARGGMNWPAYWRRLGLIAGGAVLVTIATWWFDPATFVFFGILHEIVVASLLALPFLLILPWWVTAVAAAGALAAPWFLASPIFNGWPLWWVGLSSEPPTTVDYVPVLPWFGVVLIGILAGRVVAANAAAVARVRPQNAVARVAAGAGRWSLVIYLAHQPLIVGVVALTAFFLPPSRETVRANFMTQCVRSCTSDAAEAASCASFCTCMFDGLYGTPLFTVKSRDDLTPEQQVTVETLLDRCSAPSTTQAPQP